MKFQSKTAAYVYAIYLCTRFRDKYLDDIKTIDHTIALLKQCVENHAQNPSRVANILKMLEEKMTQLAQEDKLILTYVAQCIEKSTYIQSPQEKWENRLGRRFESQLQIEVLQNPTPTMMTVIGKLSDKIIKILEANRQAFLLLDHYFDEPYREVVFGKNKDTNNTQQVITLLRNNQPQSLTEILYIHYVFSRFILRSLTYTNDHAIAETAHHIADIKMYNSDYFKNRGRGSQTKQATRLTGIGVENAGAYNDNLPRYDHPWIADARTQAPDLNSSYTRALVDSDTPYVAGPSGMASMMMGQMLALDAFQTPIEKQYYIAAVAAYIVGGGFHSIHEVLGPIALCLSEYNLISKYPVNLASTLPEHYTLMPAKYSVFYRTLCDADPAFLAVWEQGWKKFLAFFETKGIFEEFLLDYEALTRKDAVEPCTILKRLSIKRKPPTILPGGSADSAIFQAIHAQHIESVIYLLFQHQSCIQSVQDGRTPMQLAAELKLWRFVAIMALLKTNAKDTGRYGCALLCAAQENNLEVAIRLLHANAPITYYFPDSKYAGYYPIHFAVYHDNFALLEAILKKHPNSVNFSYKAWVTPLALALEYDRPDAVALLLQNGALPCKDAILKKAAEQGKMAGIHAFCTHAAISKTLAQAILPCAILQKHHPLVMLLSKHCFPNRAKAKMNFVINTVMQLKNLNANIAEVCELLMWLSNFSKKIFSIFKIEQKAMAGVILNQLQITQKTEFDPVIIRLKSRICSVTTRHAFRFSLKLIQTLLTFGVDFCFDNFKQVDALIRQLESNLSNANKDMRERADYILQHVRFSKIKTLFRCKTILNIFLRICEINTTLDVVSLYIKDGSKIFSISDEKLLALNVYLEKKADIINTRSFYKKMINNKGLYSQLLRARIADMEGECSALEEKLQLTCEHKTPSFLPSLSSVRSDSDLSSISDNLQATASN